MAPEGIEHRAATLTVAVFSLNERSEYHQKYHHLSPRSTQYVIGCPVSDYVGLLPVSRALPFVLRLGVGNGLPLHVARCMSPMAGNRDDMVDHVALAGAFG